MLPDFLVEKCTTYLHYVVTELCSRIPELLTPNLINFFLHLFPASCNHHYIFNFYEILDSTNE